MIDNSSLPPLYQCSGCKLYENGCSFIEKMREVMISCPNLDPDTTKCKEYTPKEEWKDLKNSLYQPSNAEVLKSIKDSLVPNHTVTLWETLENAVYFCVLRGHLPFGVKLNRKQLEQLEPNGTLFGYRVNTIKVLGQNLEVVLDETVSGNIILLYK